MSNLRQIATKPSTWLAIGAAGAGLYLVLRASGRGLRAASEELPQHGPNIVILGAGFAGLTAASEVKKRLGNKARITLVDRHNYHLFTPLLFQVGTCGVDPYDVAFPIHQFTGRHRVAFRRGTVTGIDLNNKRIQLQDGQMDYDHLVIALGSTTNFFDNQSAEQYALPLKQLEDGVAIRNQVVDMLERASVTSDPAERQALLTFVVVGGGATGVETACALVDLLKIVVPTDYPSIRPEEPKVILLEALGKLLGHMNEKMSATALDHLRATGVEVWLNTQAKEVNPTFLTTSEGHTVPTRTIIWATGVQIPSVVASMEVQHGKGGSLAVDQYLQVQGYPGVYAVGDDAQVMDHKTNRPVPLLAATAVQEGKAAAENLARALEGRPPVPFHFRSYGDAVTLGRNAGTAEFGGIVLDGFLGWLIWRVVHWAKITSFRNKLATAVDWSIGYMYDQDTARLEVRPAPSAAAADGATADG